MRFKRFSAAVMRHESVLIAVIVVVLFAGERLVPGFADVKNQWYFARHLWELAVLAVGMTLVVISGGIDLSVGSIMGLSAVSFGMTYQATSRVSVAIGACLLTGLFCGLLNGGLVVLASVHPLIVTLATHAAYRGIAEGISHGQSYSAFGDAWTHFARDPAWGLTAPAWLFIASALLATLFLRRSYWGRYVYAMGLNEQAARFSGIPIARLKCALFAVSGLLSGLAAALYVARFDSAKADVGQGFELEAITAVILGGTRIEGGRGNLIGTALGLLLVHETRLFVSRYWRMDEIKPIAVGALLIASLLIYQSVARRSSDQLSD